MLPALGLAGLAIPRPSTVGKYIVLGLAATAVIAAIAAAKTGLRYIDEAGYARAEFQRTLEATKNTQQALLASETEREALAVSERASRRVLDDLRRQSETGGPPKRGEKCDWSCSLR